MAACRSSAALAPAASDAATADAAVTPCAVPAGADPRVTIATPRPGVTCTRYPFQLAGPREAIEARDGSIYVTEWTGGRVSRFTPSGFVTVASGLDHPLGIRELPDGSLLVVEEVGHALARVDPTNGSFTRVATNLGYATDMTLGLDGSALVGAFPDFDRPGTISSITLEPDGGSTITERITGVFVPEALYVEPSGAIVLAQWTTAGGGARGPANVLRFPSGTGDASSATVVAQGFDHVYGVLAAKGGGTYLGEIFDEPGHDRVVRVGAPTGGTESILDGVAVPGGMMFTRSGDLLLLEGVDINHAANGYLIRLSGL